MASQKVYSSKNLFSNKKLENMITSIIDSLGLNRPHYSLGVVASLIDSDYAMIKVNGDITPIKIKKSPDLTLAVGNGVLIINNINGTNTKFIISRTKI
jgi:hypothetical protein